VAVACICSATTVDQANTTPGLLAEWNFDEGQGLVARDASGHGRDATLSEPVWIEQAEGSALNLDGLDDFVDFGNIAAIGIGGPLTIEAWVKPLRQTTTDTNLFGEGYRTYLMTYYITNLCWYVGHGGGATSNWLGKKLNLNKWSHVAATFDGAELGLWVNGRLAGRRKSVIETYKPQDHFMIGTKGQLGMPRFKGSVARVRIYDRSLSGNEIVDHFKSEAEHYGFGPTWFKRVRVTPYDYQERGQLLVEADYTGLQPLAGQWQTEVTLAHKDRRDEILYREVRDELHPEQGLEEIILDTRRLEPGDYVVRVQLTDGHESYPQEEFRFTYPTSPLPLPSPAQCVVGPLPPAVAPTPFDFEMNKGAVSP